MAREPKRRNGAFARYWSAAAVSSFGSAVTAVALPVLVVQVLGATPFEVGIVNAAGVVPYAVLGVFAGVVVDRVRRRPLLIAASIGRALSLGAVPLLWAFGLLNLWTLVALLLLFGACSVFGAAASQSLLPSLVPRADLLPANARLDQVDAAAQTAGPALGGGLVSLLGAPLALAVDAVSFLVEAVLVARIRVEESAPRRERRRIRDDIREGLRFAYRHPRLGALSVSTHVWFVGNAVAFTVFATYALGTLALSGVAFGFLLTASGIAMLVGAALATVVGKRLGAGWTIVLARVLYPVAWLTVALIATVGAGEGLLVLALVVQGFAAGIENAHEMAYRQAVTPDRLLGRVNASMRAVNRTMAAVGALAGGAVAALAGVPIGLWAAVAVFVVAAAIAAISPLRHASHDEDPSDLSDDDPA